MSHQLNITRIKAVYNALGELKNKVVFAGGATVSLYSDRPESPEVRATDDVDIVVEITTRTDYTVLEEQLRNLGFVNDTTADFIGRFLLKGIVLDVMPMDESILGFSNKWYTEGFKTAIDYKIDNLHTVKILAAPFFVASKLEAFKNRGNNDGRTSTDFEDIIFILENRRAIWDEMKAADTGIRTYLLNEFKELADNPYIEEWIDGHTLESGGISPYIMQELRSFIFLPG